MRYVMMDQYFAEWSQFRDATWTPSWMYML